MPRQGKEDYDNHDVMSEVIQDIVHSILTTLHLEYFPISKRNPRPLDLRCSCYIPHSISNFFYYEKIF